VLTNRFENSLCLTEDFVIPESEYVEALLLQECRAKFVGVNALSVLPTIDFNHQRVLQAYEVNDVAADWHLSLELQAQKTMRAQVIPKAQLSVGLL